MEAIKESISHLTETFHLKLAEFEERQLKLSSPSSTDASSLAAEFSIFKTFVVSSLRTLQTQVQVNARSIDNLEMHNRKNVLLLHGIPEDKKADISTVIVDTVVQKLKVPEFNLEAITRFHRLGRSSDESKPRPILVQVRDYSMRSKIWAAKKNLKNSGITLSEFLTKPRHDAFMLARQRFGVSKCWSHEGFVFVLSDDGVRHRVTCVAELERVKVQGVSGVTIAAPREPIMKESSASVPTKTRRAATRK